MSSTTPSGPVDAPHEEPVSSRPWFAAAGGLGLAMLVLIGCLAAASAAPEGYYSRLTDVGQGPLDAARIWSRNLPFLAASALFSLGLARSARGSTRGGEERGLVFSRRRLVVALLAAATIGRQAVVLGGQLASLAAQVGRPAWMVLVCMPHGLFEFTGVFLPFGALIDGLRHPGGVSLERRIVLSAVLGVAVLLLAATIEALFTPHVLSALSVQPQPAAGGP